jgi:hypothetical protein
MIDLLAVTPQYSRFTAEGNIGDMTTLDTWDSRRDSQMRAINLDDGNADPMAGTERILLEGNANDDGADREPRKREHRYLSAWQSNAIYDRERGDSIKTGSGP